MVQALINGDTDFDWEASLKKEKSGHPELFNADLIKLTAEDQLIQSYSTHLSEKECRSLKKIFEHKKIEESFGEIFDFLAERPNGIFVLNDICRMAKPDAYVCNKLTKLWEKELKDWSYRSDDYKRSLKDHIKYTLANPVDIESYTVFNYRKLEEVSVPSTSKTNAGFSSDEAPIVLDQKQVDTLKVFCLANFPKVIYETFDYFLEKDQTLALRFLIGRANNPETQIALFLGICQAINEERACEEIAENLSRWSSESTVVGSSTYSRTLFNHFTTRVLSGNIDEKALSEQGLCLARMKGESPKESDGQIGLSRGRLELLETMKLLYRKSFQKALKATHIELFTHALMQLEPDQLEAIQVLSKISDFTFLVIDLLKYIPNFNPDNVCDIAKSNLIAKLHSIYLEANNRDNPVMHSFRQIFHLFSPLDRHLLIETAEDIAVAKHHLTNMIVSDYEIAMVIFPKTETIKSLIGELFQASSETLSPFHLSLLMQSLMQVEDPSLKAVLLKHVKDVSVKEVVETMAIYLEDYLQAHVRQGHSFEDLPNHLRWKSGVHFGELTIFKATIEPKTLWNSFSHIIEGLAFYWYAPEILALSGAPLKIVLVAFRAQFSNAMVMPIALQLLTPFLTYFILKKMKEKVKVYTALNLELKSYLEIIKNKAQGEIEVEIIPGKLSCFKERFEIFANENASNFVAYLIERLETFREDKDYRNGERLVKQLYENRKLFERLDLDSVRQIMDQLIEHLHSPSEMADPIAYVIQKEKDIYSCISRHPNRKGRINQFSIYYKNGCIQVQFGIKQGCSTTQDHTCYLIFSLFDNLNHKIVIDDFFKEQTKEKAIKVIKNKHNIPNSTLKKETDKNYQTLCDLKEEISLKITRIFKNTNNPSVLREGNDFSQAFIDLPDNPTRSDVDSLLKMAEEFDYQLELKYRNSLEIQTPIETQKKKKSSQTKPKKKKKLSNSILNEPVKISLSPDKKPEKPSFSIQDVQNETLGIEDPLFLSKYPKKGDNNRRWACVMDLATAGYIMLHCKDSDSLEKRVSNLLMYSCLFTLSLDQTISQALITEALKTAEQENPGDVIRNTEGVFRKIAKNNPQIAQARKHLPLKETLEWLVLFYHAKAFYDLIVQDENFDYGFLKPMMTMCLILIGHAIREFEDFDRLLAIKEKKEKNQTISKNEQKFFNSKNPKNKNSHLMFDAKLEKLNEDRLIYKTMKGDRKGEINNVHLIEHFRESRNKSKHEIKTKHIHKDEKKVNIQKLNYFLDIDVWPILSVFLAHDSGFSELVQEKMNAWFLFLFPVLSDFLDDKEKLLAYKTIAIDDHLSHIFLQFEQCFSEKALRIEREVFEEDVEIFVVYQQDLNGDSIEISQVAFGETNNFDNCWGWNLLQKLGIEYPTIFTKMAVLFLAAEKYAEETGFNDAFNQLFVEDNLGQKISEKMNALKQTYIQENQLKQMSGLVSQ